MLKDAGKDLRFMLKDATLPGLNAFLPVFGSFCVYTYEKICGRTAKTSVFRDERRLASSFHDTSFVPLL